MVIKKGIITILFLVSVSTVSSCNSKNIANRQENSSYNGVKEETVLVDQNQVVKTEEVKLVQIGNVVLDGKDAIIVLDTINSSKFDDEWNDGRMIKIEANIFTINIQYEDESQTTILLWEDRIKVDQIWYQLDIKPIVDILVDDSMK